MMNDIQPQNFLSNFDDPAAALLTYFINENDNGAAMMPVVSPQMPPQNSGGALQQLSPQDHAYTRHQQHQQAMADHAMHQQGGQMSQQNAPPSYQRQHNNSMSALPQVQSSQTVGSGQPSTGNHQSAYVDVHQHMAPASSSNYTGSHGSHMHHPTANGADTGQMLYDNQTGLSHITPQDAQGPTMIKKFNYSPPNMSSQQQQPHGHNNYNFKPQQHDTKPPVKCDPRLPTNNDQGLHAAPPSASSSVVINEHPPQTQPVPERPARTQPPPPQRHHDCATPEDIKVPLSQPMAQNRNAGHAPAIPLNAEVRTVITLRITDQVVVNGNVVKETVKEQEFVRKGGRVTWPQTSSNNENSPTAVAGGSTPSNHGGFENSAEDSKQSLSLPATVKRPTDSPIPPYNASYNRNPTPTESKFNASELPMNSPPIPPVADTPTVARVGKGPGRKPKSLTSASVKKPVKPKTEDPEIEVARQEALAALLSLQTSDQSRLDALTSSDDSLGNERVDLTPAELNELRFLPLAVGNFVMAKWTDKNFYPGKIVQRHSDNRWQVVFDDGGKRTIHESEIISVPHLCAGQVVMVSFEQGFCLRGIIKRPFYERNKLYYEVEYNDSANKRLVTEKFARNVFARKDTFLTHDLGVALLAKQMKNTPENATKFADVDLNNIIPKRSRHTAQVKLNDDSSADESEPFVPKTKTKKVKTSAEVDEVGAGQATAAAAVTPKTQLKSSLYDEAPVPAALDERYRNNVLPSMDMELLGPLPPLGSGVFQGIAFLLTSVDGRNVIHGEESSAGRSTAPFDLSYLSAQIEMGGGRVYETVEEAQDSTDCIEIVLIAYTYLRTVKYMQCLAAGIPCLMHTWIVDSCRENTLLKKDNYLLPSGYSIINNSLPSDRSVFRKSANLFKGMRFMLISKNSRLKELWQPVLRASNAIIVDELPSSPGTSTRKATHAVDVIVSDSSCSATVVKKAKQFKIPIVSSEYIAQCLINGKKLSYTAHEKFKYTHIFK